MICSEAWDSRSFIMSDFSGMEDLLQDFLQEAGDLLSDVDNKLVDLERSPDDRRLLNDIFRGFHTIKGGAGFLNATELVTLCHLTENLFDQLRNAQMHLTPELMDTIMAATQGVRNMFGELAQTSLPRPAQPEVIAALRAALAGEIHADPAAAASVDAPRVDGSVRAAPVTVINTSEEPDWQVLHAALTGQAIPPPLPPSPPASSVVQEKAVNSPAKSAQMTPRYPPEGRRETDKPGLAVSGATSGRRSEEKAAARESTIRVDTARLDQVLNLSGEIGLTKNRLTSLRADILAGRKRFRDPACARSGGEPARPACLRSAELGDEDPDAADRALVPEVSANCARPCTAVGQGCRTGAGR
jgi:two-component system chemotaxis sensor kinase CheA